MFKYYWHLKDLDKVPKNTLKVFSCFSGGGGSSFGYKMSGANVVGFCECDPFMAKNYLNNMGVDYPYIMPIQEMLNQSLPKELYNLDILDGSPPCTNFSKANTTGKKNVVKKYKEGNIVQKLEDLSEVFIKLAIRLKPKVVIIENVPDIFGKKYKDDVYKKQILFPLGNAGYRVQAFLLNSKYMGVPQARKRAFVVARKDNSLPSLKLIFNDKIIPIKELKNIYTKKYRYINAKVGKIERLAQRGVEDVIGAYFQHRCLDFNRPFPTIIANTNLFPPEKDKDFSVEALLQAQSFPIDYKFLPNTSRRKKNYIIGMSVPPLMIHRVVEEIKKQWFKV